jgi:hypothetical protein
VKKRRKRRKFAYDRERRSAEVKRRIVADEAQKTFDGAIERAYAKRDPSQLCDYLRSKNELSDEQREEIAILLGRVLRNERGRPPGSQPTHRNERFIIYLARKERERLRRALNLKPGEPLPKGSIDRIIENVMASERFDGEFSKLDDSVWDRMLSNIRKELLRGVKRKRP